MSQLGEIRISASHIRTMFGQDILPEVIEAAVTMGYCASPRAPIPGQNEQEGSC